MVTRVLFMGRKSVAAKALEWLSTLPDVEVVGVLTDSHLRGSPTHMVAETLAYPTYSFEEAMAALKSGELVFDLGVSILYWRKLKEEFLSVPRMGIINFHPAPLPDYKGTGGYNFAILDGHSSWAVSAHYVDHEIDTGPLIEVSRFAIDRSQETCFSLEQKSKVELQQLITRTLTKVLIQREELAVLPNIGGRYISRPEMEAAKKIRPGDDVERKVRAFWFPPYDGAYIEIDGGRFTLVSRAILASLAVVGNPGPASYDGRYVASDNDADAMKRIQPGDNVDEKVNAFWQPPHDGAYIELDGERFTLVNGRILASLAPQGTTSLFTTQLAPFESFE